MSKGLLVKLVRIWWVGFKVLYRWLAFWIVLLILALPAMALTGLVGDYAGYVLGIIFFILTVPIVFYLTSKYLLLLGDSEDNRTACADHTRNDQDRPVLKTSTLRATIVLVPIVFALAAGMLTPPDVISQIALMLVMGVVCGVIAFIISRFKSFGPTPESIKRLTIVLVCLLSITTAYSVMSFAATIERVRNAPPGSSFGGAFTFGNLWVGSSSGGGGVSVVCAVDPPNTYGAGGATNLWTLEFGDGNSVEFVIINEQTVWIDKQHRVTFLGSVLDKDDVAIMRDYRYDENLKISSPDELLALVKKLKTEQATSTAPPEAAI